MACRQSTRITQIQATMEPIKREEGEEVLESSAAVDTIQYKVVLQCKEKLYSSQNYKQQSTILLIQCDIQF